MEDSANSYLGYNTYISSAANNIIDSLAIILYNKDELLSSDNVEKVSVYNLSRVIESLKKSDKYVLLRRGSSKSAFNYIRNNGKISGFNIIIYLGSSDDVGVGYTEFINTQGVYRDISIELDFVSQINKDINIIISNSLSALTQNQGENVVANEKYKGSEIWNYPTIENIKSQDFPLNTNLFTSHLTTLRNNRVESNIWTSGSNTIINNGSVCSLKITKDIEIDSQGNNFKYNQVGYYTEGDLCLYSWEDNKFYITSLIKKNRFGVPISYTPGRRYSEISGFNNTHKILYFAGRYAVISSLNSTSLYDTVTDKWIKSEDNTVKFIDEHSSRLYELPKITYYNNFISTVPDIINTSYNIKEVVENTSINVVGKIGNWYIFSNKEYGREEVMILSNLYQYIKIKSDEFPRVFFINDIYLGIKSEDGSYITIYTLGKDGYWESELYRNVYSGKLMDLEVSDAIIKFNEGDGFTGKYLEAYNKKSIVVIPNTLNLYSSWLGKFRRAAYNINPITLDSIIDIKYGLVFYKNKYGYLNYL